MNNTRHYNITIKGRVQGVYYRASTQKKAIQLGVKGFVRNNNNGDVYIEAEARKAPMELFISWARIGPPNAHVESLHSEEGTLHDFKEFIIC